MIHAFFSCEEVLEDTRTGIPRSKFLQTDNGRPLTAVQVFSGMTVNLLGEKPYGSWLVQLQFTVSFERRDDARSRKPKKRREATSQLCTGRPSNRADLGSLKHMHNADAAERLALHGGSDFLTQPRNRELLCLQNQDGIVSNGGLSQPAYLRTAWPVSMIAGRLTLSDLLSKRANQDCQT